VRLDVVKAIEQPLLSLTEIERYQKALNPGFFGLTVFDHLTA